MISISHRKPGLKTLRRRIFEPTRILVSFNHTTRGIGLALSSPELSEEASREEYHVELSRDEAEALRAKLGVMLKSE